MNYVDRARVILEYLATNEVAGTPRFIHHQLEIFRDADWSHDTTRRRLWDFQVEGLVTYLPEYGKGFYTITEQGRERVKHGISDAELDQIAGSANDTSPNQGQ